MQSKLKIKEAMSYEVRTSAILFAFRTAVSWLYYKLAHGLFGRLFTCYEREEECFESSVTGHLIGAHPGKKTFMGSLRRRVAVEFEHSNILSWFNRLASYMMNLSVRAYSIFFMAFGIYTVAIAILKHVITHRLVNPDAVITGGIAVLVAIPLSLIKKPLSQSLRESALCRLLLINLLGIHEDKLYSDTDGINTRYSIALIIGMLLGVLTYFVEPAKILIMLVLLACVWTVLSLPEAGIMAMLATIPFFSVIKHPSAILAGGVVLTVISYFIKYMRGKRTMRFGLMGAFVALFSLITLFGGIVSIGGMKSFESALVYFVLITSFSLIINLFRTRKDCRHAFTVLSVSAVIAAVYGVFQYVFGYVTANWLDTEMFAYIEGRATSFFDNPNVFGSYLIMFFPLMLVQLIYVKGIKKKFLTVFSVLVSVISLVWTWSRGAWIGFIAGTVVFMLIFSHKTLQWLLAGGLCLPVVGAFLPEDVVGRFLSIGNMGDSSTYYRVFTWRGVSRMIDKVWMSGVGIGSAAFEQVYPVFAYAGMEASPHAHNIFMQLLCETGVIGLVVFLIIIIFYAQNCFTTINQCTGRERMTVAAGLCGIISILVMGLADNVWYNYRIFFAFWSLMALTVAYINAIRSESRDVHDVMDAQSAQISINISE